MNNVALNLVTAASLEIVCMYRAAISTLGWPISVGLRSERDLGSSVQNIWIDNNEITNTEVHELLCNN